MQVHLAALGCRLNDAEISNWSFLLKKDGHEITNNVSEANLIILNSCAVTKEAAKKSRQLVRKYHQLNEEAKIVMSGCFATLEPENATRLSGVDLVVTNSSKDKLVQIINEQGLLKTPKTEKPIVDNAESKGLKTRAFIKVQDGCRNRCSFCIVTIARGKEKSVSAPDIIEQICALHQQGFQEVVLTGVHLGGYGSDIQSNLKILLEQVLAKTKIPRIRLGSLEPWDIPNGFFDLWNSNRMMPHLHLPLQSGCNKTLKRMSRRCMTDEFLQLVKTAKSKIKDLNITTDIIVGFPGETDKDWLESMNFIQEVGFGHIHTFSYSKRDGTRASLLKDHVSSEVKKQRVQELLKLSHTQKRNFLLGSVNKYYDVLFESAENINGKQFFHGYTPNYIKVAKQADNNNSLRNQIINCKPVKLDQRLVLLV